MCKDEPCYKEVNVYEKETNLLFQADEGIDHRISSYMYWKTTCVSKVIILTVNMPKFNLNSLEPTFI